jgi:predicted Zn-dependent peptidase
MDQGIVVVTGTITKKEVEELSARTFGDMVKGVADVSTGVMALGPELHADAEQVLLDMGSSQDDLWGFNIYHALPRDRWIEFDSMINIRPSRGNRSRTVEGENIRRRIAEIVNAKIVE